MTTTNSDLLNAAKTRTVEFRTVQRGENSTTPRSLDVELTPEVDAATDWTATVVCCLNADNDMPVTVEKFGRATVEIPAWMTVEFYLRHNIGMKYAVAMGIPLTADERLMRWAIGANKTFVFGVAKLLKTKKFRSGFRQNLCEQFINWILVPASERRYTSPFSARQWDCVVDAYTAREADRISSSTYYSSR